MKVKKIFFTIVIVGILVTAGLPTLLYPQLTKGRGKMSGIVTEEGSGAPLEGVTIKLFYPKANAFHIPAPKTGADGTWRVNYVRGGMWNLDFSKSGYETKKISWNVDTRAGFAKKKIELALRKLQGPAAAATVMDEINKAVVLISEKKIDQALKELQAIKEKFQGEPGIEIANLHIGNCYSSKGDYQKAIEFYLLSLEKFPDNNEIILSIGNAYGNLNNFEKATEYFNKLKIDDIGNIDTLYNIGVIAYNNGNFDRSLTFFKKATEINTEFADGFYQLGMTYTALNKQEEAVEALKKFMELAPDSPNYETAKAVVDAFGQ